MLALKNADIPLCKMLMLSMDGPNVNKTTFRLVNQEVKEDRGTGLVDIGMCNLHIVHNSYQKGLLKFGARISDIAINVHDFFDVWSAQWEDYCQVQEKLGVPQHRFLRHVASRWLSLSKAAERLQEQWPALKEYFLKTVPKAGSKTAKAQMELKSYQHIVALLRDPVAEAEVAFVIDSAKMFERFSLVFQREEPMVHLLYEEMYSLTATVIGRVCKPETLLTIGDASEPFKEDNLLPLTQIEERCCEITKNALKRLKEIDKILFLKGVQGHFIAAASHLLEKSVLCKSDTKYFKVFKPEERSNKNGARWIVKVSRLLRIPDVSESLLRDEWVLLQLEDIAKTGDKRVRIDHYWRDIFKLKNASGDIKYPNITAVAKSALTLAQGSSDVERAFSTSGQILTDDIPRMSSRTLNAKLNVKSGLRRHEGRPEQVTITSELMNSARFARMKYQEYLDREKKDAEETASRQREEEEQRSDLEEKSKNQEKARQDIRKLEEELKVDKISVKEQKKAADNLLEEAEGRLHASLKRKDFEGVHVAQGMLEGAKKMRNEVRELEDKTERLQKKVDS